MPIYAVLAFLFIWLVFLSYSLYRTKKHYRNLVEKTGKQKIDEILNVILEEGKKTKEETEAIKKQLINLLERSNFFYKKIGIVRFNPFGKVSGDQSFVMTLLDELNNGAIVNFIYTSEGLRVYTKRVKAGKGEEYQLSEEEEKAIKESK